jgi:pyruvate/2-oxoglutarate dehydrogenase complex dihydrolipoamide dehydrogenase (E3) component
MLDESRWSVEAKNIITGSKPSSLPFIKKTKKESSLLLKLKLPEVPKHLVIIGIIGIG